MYYSLSNKKNIDQFDDAAPENQLAVQTANAFAPYISHKHWGINNRHQITKAEFIAGQEYYKQKNQGIEKPKVEILDKHKNPWISKSGNIQHYNPYLHYTCKKWGAHKLQPCLDGYEIQYGMSPKRAGKKFAYFDLDVHNEWQDDLQRAVDLITHLFGDVMYYRPSARGHNAWMKFGNAPDAETYNAALIEAEIVLKTAFAQLKIKTSIEIKGKSHWCDYITTDEDTSGHLAKLPYWNHKYPCNKKSPDDCWNFERLEHWNSLPDVKFESFVEGINNLKSQIDYKKAEIGFAYIASVAKADEPKPVKSTEAVEQEALRADLTNSFKSSDTLPVLRLAKASTQAAGLPDVCLKPTGRASVVTTDNIIREVKENYCLSKCIIKDSDLLSINTGLWCQSCLKFATDGLPKDDSLFEVVSMLTRWFYFVELFDLPKPERQKKTTDLLKHFILQKHNNYCTQLNNGQTNTVLQRVEYVVNSSIKTSTEQDLFLRIREKRRKGRYKTNYMLEPLVNNQNQTTDINIKKEKENYCLSKCVIKDSDSVEIDDSLLPASVENRLLEIAKENKMRRKNGEYPFVKFARRLLNMIWKGNGKQRINHQTINLLMDKKPNYSDRHQALKYKKLLAQHKLIFDDWEKYIKRGQHSSLYRMQKPVLKVFVKYHDEKQQIA